MTKRVPLPRELAQPNIGRVQALEILRKDAEEAKDAPKIPPGGLPVFAIRRLVSVFQPRELLGRFEEDAEHIKSLEKAIGRGPIFHLLDPMLVWWSGKDWYVIDGHHRLEAYKNCNMTGYVPVEAFCGDLEQAIAESIRTNSKDKMPMRPDDKLNRAWFCVCVTGMSIDETAEACRIGTTTVTNMRKAKRALEAQGKTVDEFCEWKWFQARDTAEGKAKGPADMDAHRRAETIRMAKAMGKAIGKQQMRRDPELVAEAIKVMDDRSPPMLMNTEAWRAHREAIIWEGTDMPQDVAGIDPEDILG